MPATPCQGTHRLPVSVKCSRVQLLTQSGQPQLPARASQCCRLPSSCVTLYLQANWSDGQASNGELVQLSVNHRRTYSEGELQQMETGTVERPVCPPLAYLHLPNIKHLSGYISRCEERAPGECDTHSCFSTAANAQLRATRCACVSQEDV